VRDWLCTVLCQSFDNATAVVVVIIVIRIIVVVVISVARILGVCDIVSEQWAHSELFFLFSLFHKILLFYFLFLGKT
jgi:hypothetical protein